MPVPPRQFLNALRKRIRSHPGVNHPLLARVAYVPFSREDYKVLGMQHFPLVGMFTGYLERLLIRAPDSDAKQWIAKVLVDEYGEGSEGKDHATLYREYLHAAGATDAEIDEVRLHPAVTAFVAEHRRICEQEPFLVGLGALGPGHEWSIPHMFPSIIRGLRNAGFAEDEILYFTLHIDQDEDHGAWLEEALADYADTDEHQAQIERGAMLSLDARARFWSGVQDKIVRWRQPQNLHLRSQSRRAKRARRAEPTMASWRASYAVT